MGGKSLGLAVVFFKRLQSFHVAETVAPAAPDGNVIDWYRFAIGETVVRIGFAKQPLPSPIWINDFK